MDARCERSDGVHVWTRLTFTRITAATENRPFVAIGMIADIADRKRMEMDILAAKEMAEAASCAKTEFLANMSHEIRTPISGIMGISDLLLASPLNEENRQYVTMIQTSTASLLGIINDILDMSKIEARMLELSPVDFALRDMLDTVLNNFSVQARERGLAISLDCAADVPDYLHGDSHRLAQIINNLLSNALKFTERGGVRLIVVKREQSDAAVTLEFSVSDTGIGIPEEKRQRLFQYFSQGDSSFSKKYGGTGLGLAISKKLAELLGGTIWFESTPEQGTIFFFTAVFKRRPGSFLPIVDQSPFQEGRNDMRPLRILLAEDNQINRIYVSTLLRNAGHEIDLAADGQEALDALARKPYDLILMDVQMPVMDGVTATRRIRASEDPVVRKMPIIALTAYAMDGDRERLLQEGMDDYLSKPVDKERLIQVIARVAATSLSTQN